MKKGLLLFAFLVLVLVLAFILILYSRVPLFEYMNKNAQSNNSCYAGWVSKDLNKTYVSSANFSFRYPGFLSLYSKPYRTEDKNLGMVTISDGDLDNSSWISLHPKVSLHIEAHLNVNYNPLLDSGSDDTKIPCQLIDKARYRRITTSSLFGGFSHYTTSEILLPSSKNKISYVEIGCFDSEENAVCDLLLPQVLSTLSFSE